MKLFKAFFFAGILAEVLLRVPYARQHRAIEKTDQRVTHVERGLLVGLFVGTFALPAVYSLTHWLDFADYRASAAAKKRMGSVGTMLLAAAIWLFWRSHHDLGKNWSPSLEINAQQTLVTHGIYRSIRHPMYASQMLWSVAQALLLHNWLAGFAGMLSFLPLYLIRAPREERMMSDHFGDQYRAYAAHTGRVLPKFRR